MNKPHPQFIYAEKAKTHSFDWELGQRHFHPIPFCQSLMWYQPSQGIRTRRTTCQTNILLTGGTRRIGNSVRFIVSHRRESTNSGDQTLSSY